MKAKSTDGLGAIGRGEGIAAQAVALLRRQRDDGRRDLHARPGRAAADSTAPHEGDDPKVKTRAKPGRAILTVMNEVIERSLPELLDSPADTAHRVSVKNGLIGLGAWSPPGGEGYGVKAPPLHSLSPCRPRAEPQRRPDHRPQLLWTPMNLICGINPVLEALNSGTRHFDRLLVAKGLRNRRISEAISKASGMAVPLRFETRETLDRMAGSVPHQGLIAVVSPRPQSSLEDLLGPARDPALFVVLDGVEDPRNLGAILRTAEAAGCDGVLLPDRHNAGLSETVNRASAGALEHVHLARIGNVVQSLEALKARGIWVVGFDATGTERWDAVDYKRPVALVLGGEGKGIRRLVREHCDHLVSLPALRPRQLAQRVGGGGHRPLRGDPAARRRAEPRAAHSGSPRPRPRRWWARPQTTTSSIPGAHGPGRSGSRPSGDDEDEDPDVQVVTVHDEEAAWTGPTVLKAVDFRRGRPRPLGRGRGPGGKGGRRHDRGQAPSGRRRAAAKAANAARPRLPTGPTGARPPGPREGARRGAASRPTSQPPRRPSARGRAAAARAEAEAAPRERADHRREPQPGGPPASGAEGPGATPGRAGSRGPDAAIGAAVGGADDLPRAESGHRACTRFSLLVESSFVAGVAQR